MHQIQFLAGGRLIIKSQALTHLSRISDEISSADAVEGNVGDAENGDAGNDNDGSRYVPAHHGKFLSNFERDNFHPMNVTPDRPCSAYFHVSKEFTSKDIFDSLSADGISVEAVKCLQ